jgi:hypothetical protein
MIFYTEIYQENDKVVYVDLLTSILEKIFCIFKIFLQFSTDFGTLR